MNFDAECTEEAGDELRSKALATEKKDLPEAYFRSSRLIGTFIGIAFTLAATYFLFQAAAGAIIAINEDIGPSSNASLALIV